MAIPEGCLTPPASCNLWINQSPGQQRFMLLQLLNALLDTPLTLDQLKTASDGWWCQGSPAKIRALQAQMVGTDLEGAVTAQPICWTPLQLEGAIGYLYCGLLAQVA